MSVNLRDEPGVSGLRVILRLPIGICRDTDPRTVRRPIDQRLQVDMLVMYARRQVLRAIGIQNGRSSIARHNVPMLSMGGDPPIMV